MADDGKRSPQRWTFRLEFWSLQQGEGGSGGEGGLRDRPGFSGIFFGGFVLEAVLYRKTQCFRLFDDK